MSSGQIVTGLQVGGALGFELAKEPALEDFMASALYNDWDIQALVTVDLTIAAATNQIERASGNWSPNIVVGDLLTLSGFATAANNTQVMVAEIVAADTIRVVPAQPLVDEAGTGTAYKRADRLEVGVDKKSFSMCKQFLDLTTKGINYRGMIVSEMELNVAFGELVGGSFTFSGNDYVTADSAPELMTNGRTLNAAATTQTFNGSVDMPFFITSAIGTFGPSDLAVQSLAISLNNNLSAQTVIGDIAPIDYSAGTAQVGVEMNAYLNNANWSILDKKLTQDPFQVGFMVKNNGGWYGFYMPSVQVSFEDPASAGANQDILLNMTGTAKVGPNQEKSFVIYRS